MFRRSEPATVAFDFEGTELMARDGETIAAALLAAGIAAWRTTPVSGAERGPWCLMGICFDCRVEIDGTANRQACMVPVKPGMKIRRQTGARLLA